MVKRGAAYVFTEAEKVGVSDRANRSRPAIPCCPHVQDGDLAEVRACTQSRQNSASIVCHDLEFPAIHDEHLLPDLSLSTDVVRGREEHGFEAQDESTEEASLCVLENLHSLQCIQMNVDRDLRL